MAAQADGTNTYIEEKLKAINEKPLKHLASNTNKEVYRFYWARSFESILTYTIDMSDSKTPTVVVRKYSNENPAEIISESKSTLTATHIENLKMFLLGSQFWSLPSKNGKTGFDGATWILEGIKDEKYHYTKRWSPLPPYFGWSGTRVDGELIMKRLNPPFENQVKHSDEVGLDFLCLYIMLMTNQSPEVIY
jgi:hypothetical protein